MVQFLIFTGLQIVNAGLSTFKSMVLAKSTNVQLSALMNALAFGYYAIVVKMIANVPLVISITGSAVANLVGVYLAYWIFNKTKKVKLWRIEVTLNPNSLKDTKMLEVLRNSKVPMYDDGKNQVTMYCYSMEHSHKILKILDMHKHTNYNIVETINTINKR